MQNKKAFSFVEIIITISIIALLAVIGISSKQGYDENMNNTKVVSDIETINNALEAYSQENSNVPMPGGNINFFEQDTSYSHSYDDSDTFGVYGSITENTIPKKFLDVLPLDPRTSSYYSYGKTKETNKFEIAAVQIIDGSPVAKVTGNYPAETGPYNLIREYNGSNFVYDSSKTNLPYNPDELVMIATTSTGHIYREGDTIITGDNPLELFFSDGSVSILEANSELTLDSLDFKGEDNLNTLVRLGLGAGSIWTKATSLNDESEFEIYTTDSTAAVRGTIFGVVLTSGDTETILVEGEIFVSNGEQNYQIYVNKKEPKQSIKIGEAISVPEVKSYIGLKISPDFTKNKTERDNETEARLNATGAVSAGTGGCTTFSISGFCQDNEAYPDLTASGYTLIAHAPYSYNDFNLYKDGGNFSHTGQVFNINNTGGLNAIGTDGFLKYDGLGLSGDFAIEMSVKGSALQPGNDNPHYLYKAGDIFLKVWGKHLMMGYTDGGTQIKLKIDKSNLLGLNQNNYYTIIAIYNGNDWELKFESITPISYPLNIYTPSLINYVYIGSSSSSDNQLNSIIDYVKIYKKP